MDAKIMVGEYLATRTSEHTSYLGAVEYVLSQMRCGKGCRHETASGKPYRWCRYFQTEVDPENDGCLQFELRS